MALSPQKLAELKAFVAFIKANPQELHNPALSFFKEFLEQGGYHVPAKAEAPKPHAEPKKEEHKHEQHAHKQDHKHEHKHETPKPAAAAPAHEHDDHEEADEGVVPADHDAPQSMGSGKEPSEDDMAKASTEKAAAMEAQGNGNYEQAIAHFTAAINANSKQAMLFALRANAYASLKKPNAAIRDCDHAIQLNPDSAKAFKVRGKANRMLGKYEEALKDLATGQRIDFDEGSAELIKFLEQRVAKRRERNRKKEEAEKRRREEEAKAKAQTPDPSIYDDMPGMEDIPNMGGMPGGFPGMGAGAGAGAGMDGMPGGFPGMGGMGGMGGGMPAGMDAILKDPEVLAMMQDPEVMNKLMKMMSGGMPNPAELAADPKLRKLFEKFGAGKM